VRRRCGARSLMWDVRRLDHWGASVLKKLAQLLTFDLTRRTWNERAHHPYFGDMLLFAFRDRPTSYWECELQFEDHTVGISVEAPDRKSPSDAQADFARRLLSDIDTVVAQAKPLLAGTLEKWGCGPMPEDWRTALRLEGFTVPENGDSQKPWDVSFSSLADTAEHLYTCAFDNGAPTHVSVDG
jgi:hypothetical protein